MGVRWWGGAIEGKGGVDLSWGRLELGATRAGVEICDRLQKERYVIVSSCSIYIAELDSLSAVQNEVC